STRSSRSRCTASIRRRSGRPRRTSRSSRARTTAACPCHERPRQDVRRHRGGLRDLGRLGGEGAVRAWPQDAGARSRATHRSGADWPIRYADIAPWYDYVEEAIGVRRAKLGLAQLPDGKFLPPMPLNCAEQVVQEAVARRFGGERVVTIGRCAEITVPHGGRAACHYCGPCERGCITRSYFSSVSVTLPLAQATGRVTLDRKS